MDKCLDTVRQKPKSQISITTYHEQEKSTFFSKKMFLSLFFIVAFSIAASLFHFVNSNSDSIYAKEDSTSNSEELAAMTAKKETAKRIEIEEEKKRLADTIKRIADERVQIKAQEIKAKADKEAQIAQEIAAQAAVKRVIVTRHGGFDNIYAEAEKKYGVPRQILAAVHYVETGQSGDTTRVSYAGAQGPMQFMPNTFRAYAQDGDGDGQALINNAHDAIFSAAKYLAANGAANGNISNALYRYCHSYSYVSRVLSLARALGYPG
jgi:membrane-bound lytic murein transglycosylase B